MEEQQPNTETERKNKSKRPIWVAIIAVLSLVVASLKISSSVDMIGLDQEVRLLILELPATAAAIINLLLGICFAAAGFLLFQVKDLGRLLFTIAAVTQCIMGIATGIPMITRTARGIGIAIGIVLSISILAYAISYLYSDKVDDHFHGGQREG